jgi:integrase
LSIKGYAHREAANVNLKRVLAERRVRIGIKKAEPTWLTSEQADQLMAQPDTPLGRRDAFLMCLLLEHGLRVGEVTDLKVADLDLNERLLTFYRPKVHKIQAHRLTDRTYLADRAYLEMDAPH